jgi:hypothetical protein
MIELYDVDYRIRICCMASIPVCVQGNLLAFIQHWLSRAITKRRPTADKIVDQVKLVMSGSDRKPQRGKPSDN